MKKTLFSLEEIIPSSIYKNNKEINLLKNKEKGNTKTKSFLVNKKESESRKKLKEDSKINNISKTPMKLSGKTKINKLKIIMFCVHQSMESKFFYWNFF